MKNLYKQYKDAFWGRVDTLKAQVKSLGMNIAFNDKKKAWTDRLARGKAIVDYIACTNELRSMVG